MKVPQNEVMIEEGEITAEATAFLFRVCAKSDTADDRSTWYCMVVLRQDLSE